MIGVPAAPVGLHAVVIQLVQYHSPSNDRSIRIRQVHQHATEVVGRRGAGCGVVAYIADVLALECARVVAAVWCVEWVEVTADACIGG